MDKSIKLAFTLIELLVVIAIIGILSGLIVVTMNGVTAKANIAKSQVFSNSLRNALMLNLVAEYKLDGSAVDSWGGKNGTLHGPTTVTSECPQGSCLSFNGSSDYINIADDAVFNFGSKMTVMAWIKGGPQSDKYFLGHYEGSGNNRSWLFGSISSNKLVVLLSSNGSWDAGYRKSYYSTSAVAFDSSWHLVGFTWNSGSLKLYIDGQDVSVTKTYDDSFTAIYNSSGNLSFGTYLIGGVPASSYYTGLVDETRLYNEAIPVSLIKEQYYAGLNNLLSSGSIGLEEYQRRIDSLAGI